MPSGDDDEIVARRAPWLFLGELFFGALLVSELLFGELLARRTFLECRTFIRFWSSKIVDCTGAELMSIRPPIVMHMGFAVRTHASDHVSREVIVNRR